MVKYVKTIEILEERVIELEKSSGGSESEDRPLV